MKPRSKVGFSGRRDFLKALAAGAVTVIVAPLMPVPVFAEKPCRCGKPHGKPKYSTKEQMIADLVDNVIETHDRLLEERLFADVNTPGRANSLVGFSEVLRG